MSQDFQLPIDSIKLDRTELPVSGTMIREDIHENRRYLAPGVYPHFVKLIVLMGAESTGKSSLAKALAEEVDTTWVHEYGRDYYEAHGGKMTLEGYTEIAKEHIRREEAAKTLPETKEFIFVDTNALTTLMFSYLYERDSDPELMGIAEKCISRYFGWILCDDDIPFEQDGWRDDELTRKRMQGAIIQDLATRGIKFHRVSGSIPERVNSVLYWILDEEGIQW
jgi:NadR type nicotinamide-nucleotide adenylyltransferase